MFKLFDINVDSPSMNEKTYFLLIGPPCAGKTTFREKLSNKIIKENNWNVLTEISTDDEVEYLCHLHNLNYNQGWNRHIKQATEAMNKNLKIAFGDERCLVIIDDHTNLTSKRITKINEAKKHGYKVIGIFFKTPDNPKEYKNRLNSRTDKIIPWEIVQNMIITSIIPNIEEGYNKIFAGN